MDQLRKEREAFMQKAFALPVIEKRKQQQDTDDTPKSTNTSNNSASKRKRTETSSSTSTTSLISTSSSSYFPTKSSVPLHNFSILTKIVNSMKERFLNGDCEALTFDELLDDTNQLDLSSRQKQWLLTEALPNNQRITVTDDGKYAYKPVFNIRDRKSLIRLLEKYDSRGLGAITYEDIKESLPNADRILKFLQEKNQIIIITRPVDKKRIVFINNLILNFTVDEEFQKAWRSIAVEGMDEMKIEEYLKNHGINSMEDMNIRKKLPVQKRKENKKRKSNFKKLNNHLDGLLEDYSDKQP